MVDVVSKYRTEKKDADTHNRILNVPVSYAFPDRRKHDRQHHMVEYALEDHGQAQQIIPIDIDAHEATDRPAGAQKQQPVPLPPPPDDVPLLMDGQEPPPVLAQVHQREEDGERKHGRKGDPDLAARLDGVDGRIARGTVDERAIP